MQSNGASHRLVVPSRVLRRIYSAARPYWPLHSKQRSLHGFLCHFLNECGGMKLELGGVVKFKRTAAVTRIARVRRLVVTIVMLVSMARTSPTASQEPGARQSTPSGPSGPRQNILQMGGNTHSRVCSCTT